MIYTTLNEASVSQHLRVINLYLDKLLLEITGFFHCVGACISISNELLAVPKVPKNGAVGSPTDLNVNSPQSHVQL